MPCCEGKCDCAESCDCNEECFCEDCKGGAEKRLASETHCASCESVEAMSLSRLPLRTEHTHTHIHAGQTPQTAQHCSPSTSMRHKHYPCRPKPTPRQHADTPSTTSRRSLFAVSPSSTHPSPLLCRCSLQVLLRGQLHMWRGMQVCLMPQQVNSNKGARACSSSVMSSAGRVESKANKSAAAHA